MLRSRLRAVEEIADIVNDRGGEIRKHPGHVGFATLVLPSPRGPPVPRAIWGAPSNQEIVPAPRAKRVGSRLPIDKIWVLFVVFAIQAPHEVAWTKGAHA